MHKIAFICYIGACIRLLIYRMLGNKKVTREYLQGEKDEQQLTSVLFGFAFVFLLGFLIYSIIPI